MKRILIAEDQAAERNTLTEYMRSYAKESGHEIKCRAFSDGADLLEEYEAGTDLILMDIRMPNLDGIEATRRIRQLPDPGRARVPIVAMTANVYEKDRTAAFEAGMDAFVEKPIAVDRLLATLSRYLSATECERTSNL